MTAAPPDNVVAFPAAPPETTSPFGALWGKRIQKHGYAAIPVLMVHAQHRLGVNPTQFGPVANFWR